MRRNTFISVLFLLASVTVWAGPVSKEAAMEKARAFIGGTLSGNAKKAPGINRQASLQTVIEHKDYYVFNVGSNQGFVIASGSDKTQPIFGYSDTGSIDPKHMPEPLKQWFNELPIAVKSMEMGIPQQRSLAPGRRKAPKVKTKNAIPVLVSSRWNQGDPYNLLTPEYKDDDGNMQPHSATGCVATAMAQVMYYWKWPQEACKTIPSYSSDWNMQRTLPELEPKVFDWDNMLDVYTSSATSKQKNAVAELMLYVGHSIKMGYGPASGAWSGNCAIALRDYYDYDRNLYHADHGSYTYQEWEDLIYNELAAGRPVLISGDNSDLTGGHEWVCDGYDGNGCFHQNWGWGGMSDGYFVLTVMQPDNQGIGGSTSSDGYSMSHTIVVGLQPSYMAGETEDKDIRVAIANVKPGKNDYTRASIDSDFNLSVSYELSSSLSNSYTFDTTFGIYDASGQLVKETTAQKVTMNPNSKVSQNKYARFSGLEDGQYSLKALCRINGTNEWFDMIDNDDYALKATISEGGTKLHIEAETPVAGDYKLVFNEFELIGASAVGSEQKVRVNVTNTGTGEYYRNTFLVVDGQWVSGNCIAIPAGRTMDVYFKYKPETLGRHTFVISTQKGNTGRLYQTSRTLEEAPKTTISVRAQLLNKHESGKLYCDEMRMAVSVYNRGTERYNSWIKLSGWRWTTSGWGYGLSSKYFDVDIPAGKDTIFYCTMSNLEYTSHYGLDFEGNEAMLTRAAKYNLDGPTITAGGILYWTADGIMEGIAPQNNKLRVNSDIAAVAIPGTTTIPTILLEDDINPNLIVYYQQGANVPSRVMNVMKSHVKNIVIGDEIEEITFDARYPAYVPKPFTAKKASTAVTPETPWGTLVLPYAPKTITADGTEIKQFSDKRATDGQIVIKEYAAQKGNRVYFDYADELKAYRPYLVAYSGTLNGTAFDLTGKEVVFGGEDIEVGVTANASTYASDHKFVGTLGGGNVEKAYTVTTDGQRFSQQPTPTVAPFSAYFMANNVDAEAESTLYVVADNGTVGIRNINEAKEAKAIFNLQGQRVSTMHKGLYIIDGQKVRK